MANQPLSLTYGHLGQPVYDTENNTWIFDRKLGQSRGFREIDSWKSAILPIASSDAPSATLHSRNRDIQLAAKGLSRDNPELYPSLSNLHEGARVSAAIISTTETYDPAFGTLLSFGSFTAEEAPSRHVRRIAALPSGESGNILRLVALAQERNGWNQDRNNWLEGPSFMGGESGYWIEEGAPIQQVCFAQGEDRSGFLAVRLPSRTVIFRPCHSRDRKSAERFLHYELPSSRIHPHPIASINIERTGGIPHADVTFNVDYQRQFGVIDQLGKWQVWDIDGGHRAGSDYTLALGASGSLESDVRDLESKEALSEPHEDGWARIMWIGDVNTIVVCTRRKIETCDIRGGKTTRLHCPEIIPPHSTDWILDVKRPMETKSQFLVLTNTKLIFMGVQCKGDSSINDDMDCGSHVLLSVVHSRSPEDVSLQISVTVSDDSKLISLVRSTYLT